MQSELDSLLELQDKDRVVMAVENELQAFEPELEELDAELNRMEQAVAAARHRAEEFAGRREALEGKIESYRLMQERRRQRLEWVRGAKEASTLMAELDLARAVMAKEEAEWIRSADEVQEAERVTADLEQQLHELTEAQAPRRAEIAGAQADLRGRLHQAEGAREQAAKRVERPLRSLYERIKQGRAPLALYPLHGGACGHCYTAVPMHVRQQVLQGKALPTCEVCGVLIYTAEE